MIFRVGIFMPTFLFLLQTINKHYHIIINRYLDSF